MIYYDKKRKCIGFSFGNFTVVLGFLSILVHTENRIIIISPFDKNHKFVYRGLE